jgi:hypothetical protein
MLLKRFNRYEFMSMSTLKEIGSILHDMDFNLDMLTNQLYGLYDGYLYDDILTYAKNTVTPELYGRIENVVNEVNTYPKL